MIVNPSRFLTIRILYPKPGSHEDVLRAVQEVAPAARGFEGLVAVHPRFAATPWSEGERRPAENFLGLSRVV